jgi:integral membrane protein
MSHYLVNNLLKLKLQSDTKIIFVTKLEAVNNSIKAFKIISTLEAISFLVLLGIAMPLKYIWDMPQMVQIVGMAHGVLFVLYVAGAIYMQQLLNWNFKTLAIVTLCSILPFGPFYAEKKYLNV